MPSGVRAEWIVLIWVSRIQHFSPDKHRIRCGRPRLYKENIELRFVRMFHLKLQEYGE